MTIKAVWVGSKSKHRKKAEDRFFTKAKQYFNGNEEKLLKIFNDYTKYPDPFHKWAEIHQVSKEFARVGFQHQDMIKTAKFEIREV